MFACLNEEFITKIMLFGKKTLLSNCSTVKAKGKPQTKLLDTIVK